MTTPKVSNYDPGIGNVGSYQSSARPFLSGSIRVSGNADVFTLNFPNVTRWVTIKNEGADTDPNVLLRVGFSAYGLSGSNYFMLNNQESYSGDWKIKSLYMRVNEQDTANSTTSSVTASVIAGMTGISAFELPHNWTGSEGVG